MPTVRSRPSPAVSIPPLATLLLGLALLLAPRADPPAGFAPDRLTDAERMPDILPPRPRLAAVPRARTCDGGDGSNGGRPLSPATPPSTWVVTEDYPAIALLRERQGRSAFSLTVDEAGYPMACAISRTSGTGALDAAACGALMRRARFVPALDAMGCAIPARYASSVLWQIPPD